MPTDATAPAPKRPPEISTGTRRSVAETLLVALVLFLSFAAYGSWTTPVPGINEPHYLGKAKHFWNPDWCARDVFLQSADAHWFFYATFGAVTRALSLEQTAWLGRVLTWTLIAWSWARLGAGLFSWRWSAVGAMWLYLAWYSAGTLPPSMNWLRSIVSGPFAGEWLIGGVESKGFAYGFLFLALAEANESRWNRAAVWLGLSISFHPVVGGWGAIAAAAAIAWKNREIVRELPDLTSRAIQALRPLGLCVLFAMPGLVPALAMLAAAPSAEVARHANEIQVLGRLDHHLDPLKFSPQAYPAYAWLLMAWLIGRRLAPFEKAERFFFPFVLGTLLIALGGLFVGLGPRWLGIMKYYPFRLFDLFLPLAGAALLTELLSVTGFRRAICTTLSIATFIFALMQPSVGQNPAGFVDRRHWPEFVDACRWIELHTAPDALFLTPRYNFGFKWYAQRAEFAAYKDCPQDAASLVGWQRRLDLVSNWRARHFNAGFDAAAVANLQQESEIEYILAWKSPSVDPYTLKPIFKNRSFVVYRVAP